MGKTTPKVIKRAVKVISLAENLTMLSLGLLLNSNGRAKCPAL
jgi:hypothetical protein